MSCCLLSYFRTSRIVLAITLFVALVSTAAAFTNGQPASLVLGQSNFTSSGYATTANGMFIPQSVAIDPVSGKVFIADGDNNRVLRFDNVDSKTNGAAADGVLGQPDFTSNTPATNQSGMSGPLGVVLDSSGRLWVTDNLNHRVLRFDNAATKANGAAADGVLGQANFASSGFATTASGMYFPVSVAIDSSRLWVSDSWNHRVLRFDNAASKANGAAADGVLGQPDFTSSNAFVTTRNRMSYPNGIVVDKAGHLWVADSNNNRVLRFDNAASKANGAAADGVLGQPDFTSNTAVTTQSGINVAGDVEADNAGNLWVTDYSNNRVLRFDNAASKANGAAADGVLGQPDFTSSGFATSQSRMSRPGGTAIDSSNRLWVVDAINNRVLRFDSLYSTYYLPLAQR